LRLVFSEWKLPVWDIGWEGTENSIFTFRPPSDTHSRAAVKRVRISKNTRVVSACKKKLHSKQIIFYSYSELGMSHLRLLLFLTPQPFQRGSCKYRAFRSVYEGQIFSPVIDSAVCSPFISFRSLCECLVVFLPP
jgi:hypothetical protein